MKTNIQKTAVIIVTVMTIGLVAANPLFAEDQETIGLISVTDLAFIQGDFHGPAQNIGVLAQDHTISLISSTDLAFISQPFSIPSGSHRASAAPETIGMISAADYRFITSERVPDVFTAYNDLSDSLAGGFLK